MKTRRTLSWLVAAWLGLGPCLRLCGQLADASPFLPPGAAGTSAAGVDGAAPELRGIMSTSTGYLYCIYEPARKSSSWVGVNEGGHDFVVKAADPVRDSVTLQSAGRIFTLALREAKVAAMSGPALNPPYRTGLPYPVPGMNSAEAARRLDAVAAEVRRRRQLREQADQAEDRLARQRMQPGQPQ
jgi:hypothetical protein